MAQDITQKTMHREIDAGYQLHPIGTEDWPWPGILIGKDDKGVPTFGLGITQSQTDPLWLHSARAFADVRPELQRNMPVPGMLEAVEAIFKNPLVYLESDPGYGKSYIANVIGNAMHPKGAVVADAGGKNLGSLLYETVFDSNASSDLIDRINGALRNGTMTEPSLMALRELKTMQGGSKSENSEIAAATRDVEEFQDFIKRHPARGLVEQDEAIKILGSGDAGKKLLQEVCKLPDSFDEKPGASYNSISPIVITTTVGKISTDGEDKYAKFHVIHNKKKDKTLVITFNTTSVQMPDDQRVMVVNAGDPDSKATEIVKKWIQDNAKEMEHRLQWGFFERNAVPGDKKNTPIESLLTDASIKAYSPTMISRQDKGKSLLSEEVNEKTGAIKRVFDWDGLKTAGIDRDKIDSALESIKGYQEWNGGLRIGFKDVPGALIRAAMEHRPLIIDEFARRKKGSEAALQQIWQCIAGEKGFEEMTVSLGNLGEFTLRHGDIPKVVITSNKEKDGEDVSPLSDSLWSRFVKKEIPAFSEDDWAHRICQHMTGVPITTLARLEKGHMASGPNKEDAKWIVADPDQFRDTLEFLRTVGVPAVPPLQMTLIEHWDKVNDVSKALARACHQSVDLLDAESAALQRPDMAQIRFEVDKPGDKARKLTPRDMLRNLTESLGRMGHKVPAIETRGTNYKNLKAPVITPSKEPIEAKLGDRMKEVVERWINDTAGLTVDGTRRPHLYAQLKKIWEQAGILGDNSVLNQLNISDQKREATSEETLQAKKIIDNLLKVKYPDYDGVSPQAVEAFLKSLESRPPRQIGEEKVEAHVLSTDSKNIAKAQFTETIAVASRPQDQAKPGGASFGEYSVLYPPEKLMEQDNAISTLALSHLRKDLLQAMAKLPDGVAAVPAASYTDKSPFVITTTIGKTSTGGKDAYAKMHVIHNKDKGTTLVIASATPSVKLADDSPVTVVDASKPTAWKAVDGWLKANADGMNPLLLEAFEVRNAVPDEKKTNSLAQLLVDVKGIKTYSPTMLEGRKTGRAKG